MTELCVLHDGIGHGAIGCRHKMNCATALDVNIVQQRLANCTTTFIGMIARMYGGRHWLYSTVMAENDGIGCMPLWWQSMMVSLVEFFAMVVAEHNDGCFVLQRHWM